MSSVDLWDAKFRVWRQARAAQEHGGKSRKGGQMDKQIYEANCKQHGHNYVNFQEVGLVCTKCGHQHDATKKAQ